MIVGVKHLTWAPYTSGGAGAAVVYGAGTMDKDLMVRVDMSEERNDTPFHADDHRIDRDNSVNAATVALELARIPATMREPVLGHVAGSGTTPDYTVTEDAAPYIGVGFMLKERYKGTTKFRAFWYWKVQFSEGQRSFNTKGENLEFQTESLEGAVEAVQLTDGGKFEYYVYADFDTEAAADTWLKGKGNVSGNG